ncbi:hypothetical protein [Streptomyces sp. N35]|uniref:hypothetical protein n=1 Tax=Streptomyces sp. N35 TaxID=2795730 RepID=UPI0018F485DB|nr:hypothetical protein [Streptomyces sp. N35]
MRDRTECWEFRGDYFYVLSTCTGTPSAWHFELSEARPAPVDWPASEHLPGIAAVTVLAFDPDEEKPPSVCFDGEQEVPFEVLCRFTTYLWDALRKPEPDGAT